MGKNDSPQVRDLKKCAAEYNPRKISSDELRRLKKALLEMGDLSGIIKNVATGTLIGGHQRLKVLPVDAPVEIINRYDPPTSAGTTADGYILTENVLPTGKFFGKMSIKKKWPISPPMPRAANGTRSN